MSGLERLSLWPSSVGTSTGPNIIWAYRNCLQKQRQLKSLLLSQQTLVEAVIVLRRMEETVRKKFEVMYFPYKRKLQDGAIISASGKIQGGTWNRL